MQILAVNLFYTLLTVFTLYFLDILSSLAECYSSIFIEINRKNLTARARLFFYLWDFYLAINYLVKHAANSFLSSPIAVAISVTLSLLNVV